MKIKILPLIGWCALYYFYQYPFVELVNGASVAKLIEGYSKYPHLDISSMFVQWLAAIGAYLILHKTVPQRKYIYILPAFILLFIGLSLIRYTIEEVIYLHVFGSGNYFKVEPLHYWFDNSFFTSGFALVGCIYFFFRYSLYNERKSSELIVENKKTELSFLKSQINPHFLFNSLNNLYSLIYQKSDASLPYVSKLSNLIRYSLYEGDKKIPLEKEMNYINDFIELEQMRDARPLAISQEIEEGLERTQISPYLFIPFIENAFKHGELKDENSPVHIVLKKEEKDLIFSVRNKIKKQEKDKTGGIGLENLKKRLSLIYPEKHTINTSAKNGIFEAELKLISIC